MGIYKLIGCEQNYLWGGKQFIPQLLGINNSTDQYYAEWWLGAHSSAPALVEFADRRQPLTQLLSESPQLLGKKSAVQFGQDLPYLLKILDVAKPLSIQLHPTKQQAELGFIEENEKGIALNDPKRTYKDRNHKPEMMIALSDFWLLHGFKRKSAILATLLQRPSLVTLAAQLEKQSLSDFYAFIMQATQSQLAEWLLPIIKENQAAYSAQQLNLDNPDYWVLYTIDIMDISAEKLDAGLVCFYLFNIVHLKEGEGIFQDAGIPHAYLRGQNIELMACSDNVIRGGLTPKHVDIPELLKIVDCQEVDPKIIKKAPESHRIFTYPTPAKDFALTNIRYQQSELHQCHSYSAAILLVMSGQVKISQNSTALVLKQGEAAFISSDVDYQIEGVQDGYCVVAALP
ncbi:mannose-6-phosphate isomerase, class I [Pasteurella dagmatis]|uniref:mannose-6-phosphate isomerase n=1 Tax=Pasteurella dagmatis ATCC 43325 TaxID=667128 RepID=C9PRT9_9PAST|nr:mannose-6-phosphate isomerase, class I [Pasteurella dagmatis]EEX49666.1 mannose-6-phosphate isomerase, class I [Pasteurella dagmatis ATCC 43325]SNV69533.1 mannose-6-phosphate isomerase [Pasteurella dagmatis]